MQIEMVLGDITMEAVDAIVNAANSDLAGGGGVDGAIHQAAGELALHRACAPLAPCPPGEVRVTEGFALRAKWILHTVGPVWRGGTQGEAEVLGDCYRNCLSAADELGVETVAFPSISTGVYRYPIDQAAKVAITTLRTTATNVKSVRMVAFNDDVYKALAELL